MTTITLYEGDNRVSLRRLIDQGVRVHSVVSDPPYGLTSISKRFGKEGAAPAKHGTDGAFARASKGFMNRAWDGTGIERDPEFWRLIWEILLPGGFVFAFSHPRTGHWQACAMEMAGFVMHPFHGWTYGSGMPKANNAQRAVDMKVCGLPGRHYEVNLPDELRPGDHVCPASQEGEAWSGWAYGTQTQKPALEPIYLGQKPFSEKTGAANLLKHGAGALNIDGCRVPPTGEHRLREGEDSHDRRYADRGATDFARTPGPRGGDPLGRWPANLLHDGSDNVVALFPQSKGQVGDVRGDEPSGVTDEIYGKFAGRVPDAARGDSGSAARFFHGFAPTEEDYLWAIEAGLIGSAPDADPIIYHGKATKVDRAGSKHPTVKPVGLIQFLIRHITPPGGTVLDPFSGSGTTGEAARREGFDCMLMEAEPDYVAFLRHRFNLPDSPDPVANVLGTLVSEDPFATLVG